eukprot:XP_001693655.1 predicted protein [Chlamydomonas reinhardtii]
MPLNWAQGSALQRAVTRPRLVPVFVASRAGKATDVPLAADPDSPARDSPTTSTSTSTSSGPGRGTADSPQEHEYGGIYGTAAVVLGAITGVPAFGPGGVRWEAGDVGLGLALMAPALALDALVGLPDWSTRREEDAKQLVRLFVDPQALAAERKALQGAKGSTGGSAAARSDSGGGASTAAEEESAAAARLRMALELMQETSVRNNPGARLTPLQELAVICVAVAADEMLYRAVLLTLAGRWLRDRFYEAGADDTLAVQAAQREALEQQLKRQRLGTHMTAEEVRQRQEQQARIEALQTNFASSVGVQGALVWLLEGVREVYQVAAAGGAFILTGNLAAPLAGGFAAQCLMSAYQRLGLRRSMERRAEAPSASPEHQRPCDVTC